MKKKQTKIYDFDKFESPPITTILGGLKDENNHVIGYRATDLGETIHLEIEMVSKDDC